MRRTCPALSDYKMQHNAEVGLFTKPLKLTKMKLIVERRKHKRFRVQNGVYVTLKDIYYKIGQLITISKGGFAFLYIANGEKINGRFNVDLFSGTHAFYLRNIPFKTLSDFSQNNETPFIHGKIRRCGGQFDNLIKSQKTQLYRFIKSYKNK